jgi:hypothetical protein
MQPAALPALNDPAMGTDLTTTEHKPRTTPRLPFPAAPSSGSPAGCLKDASGAALAAGPRPVLDPPARHDMAAIRETADASHARPHPPGTPRKTPLTRLRSFRDEHLTYPDRRYSSRLRSHDRGGQGKARRRFGLPLRKLPPGAM